MVVVVMVMMMKILIVLRKKITKIMTTMITMMMKMIIITTMIIADADIVILATITVTKNRMSIAVIWKMKNYKTIATYCTELILSKQEYSVIFSRQTVFRNLIVAAKMFQEKILKRLNRIIACTSVLPTCSI
jgi:hypothetical protein